MEEEKSGGIDIWGRNQKQLSIMRYAFFVDHKITFPYYI
jgi:hypothetical protein